MLSVDVSARPSFASVSSALISFLQNSSEWLVPLCRSSSPSGPEECRRSTAKTPQAQSRSSADSEQTAMPNSAEAVSQEASSLARCVHQQVAMCCIGWSGKECLGERQAMDRTHLFSVCLSTHVLWKFDVHAGLAEDL